MDCWTWFLKPPPFMTSPPWNLSAPLWSQCPASMQTYKPHSKTVQNHERKSEPFVFIILFLNLKIWWHVLRIKVDYRCKYNIFIIFDKSFRFDYQQLGSEPVKGTQLYLNSRKRYLVDLYYFSLLFVWAALSSWAVLMFWGILLHKGYQLLEVTEGKKQCYLNKMFSAKQL